MNVEISVPEVIEIFKEIQEPLDISYKRRRVL